MKTFRLFNFIFYVLIVGSVHATCPSAPGRFVPIVASPAEVIDNTTQLVWARCSAGQIWSGSTCTNTATAMTPEAALTYAASQSGWRLPNVKELASLADKGCVNPTIDASVFPGTVSYVTVYPAYLTSLYWTSSPVVKSPHLVWGVDFSTGALNKSSRYATFYVRLVR